MDSKIVITINEIRKLESILQLMRSNQLNEVDISIPLSKYALLEELLNQQVDDDGLNQSRILVNSLFEQEISKDQESQNEEQRSQEDDKVEDTLIVQDVNSQIHINDLTFSGSEYQFNNQELLQALMIQKGIMENRLKKHCAQFMLRYELQQSLISFQQMDRCDIDKIQQELKSMEDNLKIESFQELSKDRRSQVALSKSKLVRDFFKSREVYFLNFNKKVQLLFPTTYREYQEVLKRFNASYKGFNMFLSSLQCFKRENISLERQVSRLRQSYFGKFHQRNLLDKFPQIKSLEIVENGCLQCDIDISSIKYNQSVQFINNTINNWIKFELLQLPIICLQFDSSQEMNKIYSNLDQLKDQNKTNIIMEKVDSQNIILIIGNTVSLTNTFQKFSLDQKFSSVEIGFLKQCFRIDSNLNPKKQQPNVVIVQVEINKNVLKQLIERLQQKFNNLVSSEKILQGFVNVCLKNDTFVNGFKLINMILDQTQKFNESRQKRSQKNEQDLVQITQQQSLNPGISWWTLLNNEERNLTVQQQVFRQVAQQGTQQVVGQIVTQEVKQQVQVQYQEQFSTLKEEEAIKQQLINFTAIKNNTRLKPEILTLIENQVKQFRKIVVSKKDQDLYSQQLQISQDGESQDYIYLLCKRKEWIRLSQIPESKIFSNNIEYVLNGLDQNNECIICKFIKDFVRIDQNKNVVVQGKNSVFPLYSFRK